MHSSIAEKQNELADLCRRYGVARLDVFGSAARATDFDPPTGEAEFLVEFDPRRAPMTLEHYFDFRDALRHALDRPVDLLEPQAIRNPYLRAAIEESRELVYAS